jgi:hypothetical protein
MRQQTCHAFVMAPRWAEDLHRALGRPGMLCVGKFPGRQPCFAAQLVRGYTVNAMGKVVNHPNARWRADSVPQVWRN